MQAVTIYKKSLGHSSRNRFVFLLLAGLFVACGGADATSTDAVTDAARRIGTNGHGHAVLSGNRRATADPNR